LHVVAYTALKKSIMLATAIVIVSLCLAVGLSQKTDVTVTTQAGTFVGFRENVDLEGVNVTLSKFLGVPFAEPPVGDLRFRKPVAKAPLTEPYTAQRFGSACLQLYAFFPPMDHSADSEDCLFLNIFKPEIADNDDKLPVMVWIHGGGFVLGSSDPYISDALAANGPVIVVTFNYRVSLWGFLSTGDSNAPGNYGLWDQHMAIKWVNQNIGAFGGDPNKVTIFGESAGSASTLFQGLYPGNEGFFRRIISQSGTPAGSWAIKPDPLSDTKNLASLVDCAVDDVDTMVDCLRKMPVATLNSTLNNLQNWKLKPPMPFTPVVDGDFVAILPSDALDICNEAATASRERLASYELMIGFNSGEGASNLNPMFGVYTDPENFLPNRTDFEESLVPAMVTMLYGEDAPAVLNDLIIAEYTDSDDPENPDNIRQRFCDMQGDWMFLGNTYRTLQAHAHVSNQKLYMYYLNILPYKSFSPRPSWFHKPLHADDLLYVFGNKIEFELPGVFGYREFQAWEKTASDNIMTLWTNFATTGNPNQPRDLGVDWLPYTASRHRYLEIANDVTASKVKESLFERRAKLWDEILPNVAKLGRCKNADSADSTGTCTKDSCSP